MALYSSRYMKFLTCCKSRTFYSSENSTGGCKISNCSCIYLSICTVGIIARSQKTRSNACNIRYFMVLHLTSYHIIPRLGLTWSCDSLCFNPDEYVQNIFICTVQILDPCQNSANHQAGTGTGSRDIYVGSELLAILQQHYGNRILPYSRNIAAKMNKESRNSTRRSMTKQHIYWYLQRYLMILAAKQLLATTSYLIQVQSLAYACMKCNDG